MRVWKRITALVATTALAAAMMITPAFAAGWQHDSTGWWYGTNEDNTAWHANGWQWIDSNGDSVAERYYFGPDGYMYASTTTPDGYTVNADGAWTVDGAIQTQAVNVSDSADTTEQETPSAAVNGEDKISGVYDTVAIYSKFGDSVMDMDPIEDWYPTGTYKILLLEDGNISFVGWNEAAGLYEGDREPCVLTKTSENTWYINYIGVEHTLTLKGEGVFEFYTKRPNSNYKDNYSFETLKKQ